MKKSENKQLEFDFTEEDKTKNYECSYKYSTGDYKIVFSGNIIYYTNYYYYINNNNSTSEFYYD